MKAVILEKVNNEFIVLAEDESMHSVPCVRGAEVGDVINISSYVHRKAVRRKVVQRAAACAAAMLVAFTGFFSYMTFDVSAAVTTDGSASIVYYINHRGQVLKAEALNDAGKSVLDAMEDISHRPKLEEVLSETEKVMQDKGYLKEEDSLSYEIDKDNNTVRDKKNSSDEGASGTDTSDDGGSSESNTGSASKNKTEQANPQNNITAPENKEPPSEGRENKNENQNNSKSKEQQEGGRDEKVNDNNPKNEQRERPGDEHDGTEAETPSDKSGNAGADPAPEKVNNGSNSAPDINDVKDPAENKGGGNGPN